MDPASFPTGDKIAANRIMDTRELVRMHLQDPTHVFTDEEISGIRVATTDMDVSNHPLVKALSQKGEQ